MQEACFCGRKGEVEDREPVYLAEDERSLRCPNCGHLDRMQWLSGEARASVFEEAEKRTMLRKGLVREGLVREGLVREDQAVA